jgi:hypothetical protein
MRVRRETAEHPFGTLKMRMEVATEMSLHVLAYLTRVTFGSAHSKLQP